MEQILGCVVIVAGILSLIEIFHQPILIVGSGILLVLYLINRLFKDSSKKQLVKDSYITNGLRIIILGIIVSRVIRKPEISSILVSIPIIIAYLSLQWENKKVAKEKQLKKENEQKKKYDEKEREKERKQYVATKKKEIEDGYLREVVPRSLILNKGEVCYLNEGVSAGKITSGIRAGKTQNGVEYRYSEFYLTSNRVVLTGGYNFDNKLEEITSVKLIDGKAFIQFGSESYLIGYKYSEIIIYLIEYLINKKQDERSSTECEYCGTNNKATSENCRVCGAPIN